jgi:putative ABC transport system permease protein
MLMDLAVKTLWRQKLRTILTILGVTMAVQTYLMINGIMTLYDRDNQQLVSQFAGKLFIQQPVQGVGAGGDFPSLNSSIRGEKAAAILSLEGIQRENSSAVLFVPLVPSAAPNMPPSFLAIGVEPGHESALIGATAAADGSARLAGPDSVLLGSSADKRYVAAGTAGPARPGDVVVVHGREFTVEGVLPPISALYNGAVIMPISVAQDLFTHAGSVSAVILTVDRLDRLAPLQAEIQNLYPSLEAFDQKEIVKNADAMLSMQRTFMGMISASTILATVVIIMIVVMVAVMEQRKEIGTLRAVGAGRAPILGMVAGQAVILSAIGGVLAIPVSLVVGGALNYGVSLTVAENIGLWMFTTAACILAVLVAALLPAWQAVRVNPLEALRYD